MTVLPECMVGVLLLQRFIARYVVLRQQQGMLEQITAENIQ